MTLLLGAWTMGLLLALLALGVLLSFRVLAFRDLTPDGSITLGAAVTAVMLAGGWGPLPATLAGFGAGLAAGAVTGILHTKFGINGLVSGILVMTALYSVNLRVMGRSNIPLMPETTTTLVTHTEQLSERMGVTTMNLAGWQVAGRDLFMLLVSLAICALVGVGLYLFFRTNMGTAMRAGGDNPQMIQALGVDVGNMTIVGLALSNGLVALSGSLLAQYQGFADVQMGIGMVVWGLASVILGEALVATRHLGLTITGAVMGSLLFRLLVAGALRAGLNPNDLKGITAVFVFLALVLPEVADRLKKRLVRGEATHARAA